MANAFAKAAANAAVPTSGKKTPAPTILLPPEKSGLRESVDDFVKAHHQKKEAEAVMESTGAQVITWVKEQWLKAFSSGGTEPDNIKVQGNSSEVSLVSQDRCGQYNISDDQAALMEEAIGKEKASEIMSVKTSFAFDDDILAKPGVIDKLGAAIESLVTDGTLNRAEADRLLVAKSKRIIAKGSIERMAIICGGNVQKMTRMAEALGTSHTMYIKA